MYKINPRVLPLFASETCIGHARCARSIVPVLSVYDHDPKCQRTFPTPFSHESSRKDSKVSTDQILAERLREIVDDAVKALVAVTPFHINPCSFEYFQARSSLTVHKGRSEFLKYFNFKQQKSV